MFYFYFVLVLSFIVALHEFGHFVAARFFGVRVEAFSIGFGPVLYKRQFGDTEFRLSLIPLGGYVKMLGENPKEKTDNLASFSAKSWWQRIVIAFSGPFANLMLAFLFFSLSFMINSSYEDFLPVIGEDAQGFQKGDCVLSVDGKQIKSWSQIVAGGKSFVVSRGGEKTSVLLEEEEFACQPWIEPIIGQVAVGMPAYQLGMQAGDRITRINGVDITAWSQIGDAVGDGNEVKVAFSRGQQSLVGLIKPTQDPLSGRYLLGVSATMSTFPQERAGVFTAMGKGALSTVSAVWLNYYGLYKIFAKPSSLAENLSGPVMISQAAKSFSQKGLASVLIFIAFINVVLFVMNLLPIPILDGGLILFAFLEKLFRKPLAESLQTGLQYLGLFVLMFLMFFSFYNDADKLTDRIENSRALNEGVK